MRGAWGGLSSIVESSSTAQGVSAPADKHSSEIAGQPSQQALHQQGTEPTGISRCENGKVLQTVVSIYHVIALIFSLYIFLSITITSAGHYNGSLTGNKPARETLGSSH